MALSLLTPSALAQTSSPVDHPRPARELIDGIKDFESTIGLPKTRNFEDNAQRKFLGFTFTAGPEIKRTIAPKALERFKTRIREVTRRAKSVSIESTIDELAPYMRGWRSYFGFCETPEVLIGLTRWVRLRLRSALWRQWKTPRRRRAALLQLGVRPRLASNTAGSGLGPWYLARAKALSVGLSNAYFKSLGLPLLADECSRNLSNRRVRTRMQFNLGVPILDEELKRNSSQSVA